MCDIWVCDMTRSYVRRLSVWHDSFIFETSECVTWLVHMWDIWVCDITRSYVPSYALPCVKFNENTSKGKSEIARTRERTRVRTRRSGSLLVFMCVQVARTSEEDGLSVHERCDSFSKKSSKASNNVIRELIRSKRVWIPTHSHTHTLVCVRDEHMYTLRYLRFEFVWSKCISAHIHTNTHTCMYQRPTYVYTPTHEISFCLEQVYEHTLTHTRTVVSSRDEIV